jgi:hypothetical protein
VPRWGGCRRPPDAAAKMGSRAREVVAAGDGKDGVRGPSGGCTKVPPCLPRLTMSMSLTASEFSCYGGGLGADPARHLAVLILCVQMRTRSTVGRCATTAVINAPLSGNRSVAIVNHSDSQSQRVRSPHTTEAPALPVGPAS